MKELKEFIKFITGFMPWLLFLFLSGHTLVSLERAIVISLLAGPVFCFRELRGGFLLQWGTFIFFTGCAIAINLMKLAFVAKNMGIIASGFLASLIWASVLIGRPFTLQYARADLPKERWNDPSLIRGCRFIAIVWALLLTFSALIACFRRLNPGIYPDWIYFDITIGTILGGIIFTTIYKSYRRSRR